MGQVVQRLYGGHSWRFSGLDQIRPSAPRSDFDAGPSLSKRLCYVTSRSPFYPKLCYGSVYCPVPVLIQLWCQGCHWLPTAYWVVAHWGHSHSHQHRTGVTSWRSMKLQWVYSLGIKIKIKVVNSDEIGRWNLGISEVSWNFYQDFTWDLLSKGLMHNYIRMINISKIKITFFPLQSQIPFSSSLEGSFGVFRI